jgi:hypothetical protein
MARKNRPPLTERVAKAAEEALAVLGYVRPLDVLLGIRWLDPNVARRWQQGHIGTLEDAMQIDASRVAEAMQIFRAWAAQRGLIASEATCVTRTPQHQALRFTRGGDPAVEAEFRTRWISSALSDRKRKHVVVKASQPPELVVIEPLNKDWKCHRCGGSGGMLVMETPGPACLRCAGLDDLEFLPRGDALLTRRARARSALLIEAQALADAEASVGDR